jgi:hypothetical protein
VNFQKAGQGSSESVAKYLIGSIYDRASPLDEPAHALPRRHDDGEKCIQNIVAVTGVDRHSELMLLPRRAVPLARFAGVGGYSVPRRIR